MLEDKIKALIKILEESNIDEMEVSTFWGKQKIRIRKQAAISANNIELIPNKPTHSTVDIILSFYIQRTKVELERNRFK